MKVFLFDNANNKVIINEPEVLLIKEFAALWTNERNKTKEDPKGIYKSRAYRELAYIWLMIDWASPYSDYAEQDRHQACLQDANLSEDEWQTQSSELHVGNIEICKMNPEHLNLSKPLKE